MCLLHRNRYTMQSVSRIDSDVYLTMHSLCDIYIYILIMTCSSIRSFSNAAFSVNPSDTVLYVLQMHVYGKSYRLFLRDTCGLEIVQFWIILSLSLPIDCRAHAHTHTTSHQSSEFRKFHGPSYLMYRILKMNNLVIIIPWVSRLSHD